MPLSGPTREHQLRIAKKLLRATVPLVVTSVSSVPSGSNYLDARQDINHCEAVQDH